MREVRASPAGHDRGQPLERAASGWGQLGERRRARGSPVHVARVAVVLDEEDVAQPARGPAVGAMRAVAVEKDRIARLARRAHDLGRADAPRDVAEREAVLLVAMPRVADDVRAGRVVHRVIAVGHVGEQDHELEPAALHVVVPAELPVDARAAREVPLRVGALQVEPGAEVALGDPEHRLAAGQTHERGRVLEGVVGLVAPLVGEPALLVVIAAHRGSAGALLRVRAGR